jgi:CBS domain-containing protein
MSVKVSDILSLKGSRVVTVDPETSVDAVADLLTHNRVGAAPVLDARERLVGIISERDIIHGISQHGSDALKLPVKALMTREVTICRPDDTIVELMETMTNQRIRHLPVLEAGVLRGIISIGDVVKQRLGEAQFELEEMRRYVSS